MFAVKDLYLEVISLRFSVIAPGFFSDFPPVPAPTPVAFGVLVRADRFLVFVDLERDDGIPKDPGPAEFLLLFGILVGEVSPTGEVTVDLTELGEGIREGEAAR